MTLLGSSPDLMKLLELCEREEHWFLEAHHKRVAFYSSLISAILVASVAGAMRADVALDFALLTIGPILVFALAQIARDGTFRFYQRFLEAAAMRGKIEQSLGLADSATLPSRNPGYWRSEALVPERFLIARCSSPTSQAFVDSRKKSGYQRPTLRLLQTFQVVAVTLAVCLLVAAWDASQASQ